MNLPLDNVPPAENPEDQREDLTAALMELLISAAEEKREQAGASIPFKSLSLKLP
jgi:hypothetical protein